MVTVINYFYSAKLFCKCMPESKNIFQQIVDSFQDLVVFMQRRWVAAVLTTLFLIFVAGVSLGVYYLYINMKKGIDILESTHTTPESLQTNLVDSVSENMAIEKELTNMLLNSKNAVAVVFFKFHNSKTDLQGKHDFFYSGVNEVVRREELTYIPSTQNVPITRLGEFMIPFLENQCQVVKVSEITSNNWIRNKLESDNISTLASCPVYDLSSKYLLGFVEMVYLTPNDPVRTDAALKECLRVAAKKISTIISKE